MKSRRLSEKPEEELIFVSIASYRDPQLPVTLFDCITKAANPRRLRFGICWQHDGTEHLPVGEDATFRVLDVDWRLSRGACWARAEIMKLWQGEPWFLQVDSHCRFVEGWDEKLLRAVGETGSEKPVLSTYATPFLPADEEEDEVLRGAPLQISMLDFNEDGIPHLWPSDFPASQALTRPVPARFLSAGFLFAPGSFIEEVPYDPGLYFLGEEISMTVRAYTQGYDLFHPAEALVWHDYLRAGAAKHWGDHSETAAVEQPWSRLDSRSREKVGRLLRGEPVASFGLGRERTIEEYEAYAGLSFRHRRAQQYTLRGAQPPNPPPEEGWMEKQLPWIVRVSVERAELPAGALSEAKMWCVGIRDAQGFEICRRDFLPDRLAAFQGEEELLVLVCEFHSETPPTSWTVWPLGRTGAWMRRLAGRLGEGDIAVLGEDEGEDD